MVADGLGDEDEDEEGAGQVKSKAKKVCSFLLFSLIFGQRVMVAHCCMI